MVIPVGPSGTTKDTYRIFFEVTIFQHGLLFADAIGLPFLHIFGDFVVVINWENNKSVLSALNLVYWCTNISKLKDTFLFLVFQHVYREHNVRADCLSKEALSMASGLFNFTEIYDGEIIKERNLQLF